MLSDQVKYSKSKSRKMLLFIDGIILIVVSSGCNGDDRSRNPEELELVRAIAESPQSVKTVLPTPLNNFSPALFCHSVGSTHMPFLVFCWDLPLNTTSSTQPQGEPAGVSNTHRYWYLSILLQHILTFDVISFPAGVSKQFLV